MIYPLGLYETQNQSFGNRGLDAYYRARCRTDYIILSAQGSSPWGTPRGPRLAGIVKNSSILSQIDVHRLSNHCILMGNLCSCTATVPSSPSPPSRVVGSVTLAPALSQIKAEDTLALSSRSRGRTTSMPPKPILYTGVSPQVSNPRGRAVPAPQRPRSKSSPHNAVTRPQQVAAPSRNSFEWGESDDWRD